MSDWAALAADLDRMAKELPNEVGHANRRHAALGLSKVKANASGRPGPRRITGDYTRTMNVQIGHADLVMTSTIGTNAAQALRLEHGFRGRDSLGRNYNQPAFPHWRPAAEWLEPVFVAYVNDVVAKVIR